MKEVSTALRMRAVRTAAGSTHALTTVLLATDILAICAALFFVLAARGSRLLAVPQGVAIAH
ncbi:MAG TPA: hypothetical protein VIY30_00925 [Burkholderiaceae bacterium]